MLDIHETNNRVILDATDIENLGHVDRQITIATSRGPVIYLSRTLIEPLIEALRFANEEIERQIELEKYSAEKNKKAGVGAFLGNWSRPS